MLQVVPELIFRNGSTVLRVFVNVSKSFTYCLPLTGDLPDHKLLQIGLL